jgi:hypothetical protein
MPHGGTAKNIDQLEKIILTCDQFHIGMPPSAVNSAFERGNGSVF